MSTPKNLEDSRFIPRPINNRFLLIQRPTIHDTPFSLGVTIVLLRRLNHSRRSINAQNGSNHGQEISSELPIAATDVEDLVRRLRVQVAEEFLGELRDEGCGG